MVLGRLVRVAAVDAGGRGGAVAVLLGGRPGRALFRRRRVRWTPAGVGLLLVGLALVLFAVRWAAERWSPRRESGFGRVRAALRTLTGRLAGRQPPAEPASAWTRTMHLGVGVAVGVATVYGARVIWAGLGRLSAIPQDWDAVFHANGIRYIADTGDSSLVGMGTVNWFEDGVQVFYPNAYHLVGALVLRLSGVDVPTVLNAQTVLLPGMCALAAVAMIYRLGGGAVLAGSAAVCAVAATPFYDMLWRGPLLPFTTGVALLPLAVVLLLDLLDAPGWRLTVRAGVVFAAALVGLICLNPAVLFSAMLFVLPAFVQRWATVRGGCVRTAGHPGRGLIAGLLALPQLLGSLASAGGEPVDWPADLSWPRSVYELVTLSHDGLITTPHQFTHPEWALSVAVLLGVIRIRTLGRLRWLLATGLVFGGLFLLSASSDAAWVNALTRPWWNDRWRFIGLCVVPIAVFAGHGLVELHRWASARLAAVRALDPPAVGGAGRRVGRRAVPDRLGGAVRRAEHRPDAAGRPRRTGGLPRRGAGHAGAGHPRPTGRAGAQRPRRRLGVDVRDRRGAAGGRSLQRLPDRSGRVLAGRQLPGLPGRPGSARPWPGSACTT